MIIFLNLKPHRVILREVGCEFPVLHYSAITWNGFPSTPVTADKYSLTKGGTSPTSRRCDDQHVDVRQIGPAGFDGRFPRRECLHSATAMFFERFDP